MTLKKKDQLSYPLNEKSFRRIFTAVQDLLIEKIKHGHADHELWEMFKQML